MVDQKPQQHQAPIGPYLDKDCQCPSCQSERGEPVILPWWADIIILGAIIGALYVLWLIFMVPSHG